MPVWLIVLVSVVGVCLVIAGLLQIPAKNRLIDVAGNADQTKLKAKLNEGEDPNSVGWFGLTPLVTAVEHNRTENVALLIKSGANVNGIPGKLLPLQAAVDMKNQEIVDALLAAGADPNASGLFKRTPFEEACLAAEPVTARKMLEHGGDVNTVSAQGEPLVVSVTQVVIDQEGKQNGGPALEVLELLLAKGANPNCRSKEGAPLVCTAIASIPALKKILDHGAITDVEWNGLQYEPLIAALVSEEDEPAGPPSEA
jgi:ankyrin repeat protein